MTEEVKKTASHVSTVLILIVIISAGVFWYGAIYHDWFNIPNLTASEHSQGGNRILPNEFTNQTNLILNIKSDVGDVQINNMDYMQSSVNTAIFTRYSADYRYTSKDDSTNLYTFSISHELKNNTVIYNITAEFAPNYQYFHKEASIMIFLNQTFTNVSVFANLDVGNFDLGLSDEKIDNVNVVSEVGNINLGFQNTTILGDITSTASVGDVDLHLNDIINQSNSSSFSVTTKTGKIDLQWIQNYALENNFNMNLQTNVGDIDFYITALLNQTNTDITMQTGQYTGDYSLESTPEFTPISDGHYQSPGFDSNSTTLLTINATTNVGDIDGQYFLN